ncbi:hypothetical protein C8035_v004499 [Colletotrichum spinosum]|uniref:Uncharacterized protein n=1 Tax=Colletotrichum spinosum TaxID=1347390 RepID=A0A4R8PV95_9PEZI|nr:hypothetical protein C8035_v004499 [Colletotrichum spinosum]
MAQLFDLSPECVLHICSFLMGHPGEFKSLLYRSSSERQISRKLNKPRTSALNFSRTAKRYHAILYIESFRTVSISCTCGPSAQNLLSFLRLLHSANSSIADSVRRLHLHVGSASWQGASDEDIRCIDPIATSVGIDIWKPVMHGQIMLESLAFFLKSHGYAFCSFLAALLLLKTRKVGQLILSLPRCEDFMTTARVWRWSNVKLSVLQSVATKCPHGSNQGHYMLPDEFGSWLLASAPTFSEWVMQGLYANPPPDNITSLVLQKTGPNKFELVGEVIKQCRNLAKFTFIWPTTDSPDDHACPSQVVRALLCRASTLRTICLDFALSKSRFRMPCQIVSFQRFICLENLWLDVGAFQDAVINIAPNSNGDEQWANSVIRRLPKSLKKLHLSGCPSSFMSDLSWLVEQHSLGQNQLEQIGLNNSGIAALENDQHGPKLVRTCKLPMICVVVVVFAVAVAVAVIVIAGSINLLGSVMCAIFVAG